MEILVNCLATKHPKIALQWHPVKNGNLTPQQTTSGSHKKVWWKCLHGHEWLSTIYNRTCGKNNCPFCSGQKTSPEKSIQATHPTLSLQWHSKNSVMPIEISAKSNKKVWWQCLKHPEHQWKESVCNMTRPNQGCPFCSGHRVCSTNCLSTTHPELMAEWSSKNTLSFDKVSAGSNYKIWWICSKCNHEWMAKIAHRTTGSGCPGCNQSRGEKAVASILLKNGITFKREWRFKSCRNKRPLPFDFVIKTNHSIKIIEYQGEQHYISSLFFGRNLTKVQHNDTIKLKWCESHAVPLLAIPYWDFDNIEKIVLHFLNA